MAIIKPQEITIADADGKEITVTLSRFPATVGREISIKYPMANLPKVGDYKVSEETMMKLMAYVYVKVKDGLDLQALNNRTLIDTYIPDAEVLLKIEMAMLEYNFSFFRKGVISDFLNEFIQTISGKIIAMLTPSSDVSSTTTPPASNS